MIGGKKSIFISIFSLILLSLTNSIHAEEAYSKEKIIVHAEWSVHGSGIVFYPEKNDYSFDRACGIDDKNTIMLGAGFSYDGFFIDMKRSVSKGANVYNINSEFFLDSIGFELNAHKYKGYHINDSSGFIENPDGSLVYENAEKNFTVTYIKLNSFYFFSDNFSYKNSFINKTGTDGFKWSPFIKTSPGYFKIKNDKPIIPEYSNSYFNESIHDVTEINCYTLGFSAGISLIIPIWKYYIAPIVSAGIQPLYFSHNGRHENNNGYQFDIAFDFKILVGYADEDFSYGAWFNNENQFANMDGTNIGITGMNLQIFAGIRI